MVWVTCWPVPAKINGVSMEVLKGTDDTVYIPVAAASEALGKDARWSFWKQTLFIQEHKGE
jgi:hypothetical protein